MSETIVTLSGNDAALLAALRRIAGEQNKVDAGFGKIKKSSADASKTIVAGFDFGPMVEGVGKFSAAFAGIEVIAGAVNAAFDDMVRKQERSLKLSLDIGEAQAAASKNFGGMSPEQKADAFNRVDKISAATGFGDKGLLNEAMASGMGVIGDISTVAKAIEAAAPLALLSPDEIKDLSRGALGVQRATGNANPEENLGFLQSASSNAFIESNALVASRMTPILGSALREVPKQDAKDAAVDVAATFGEVSKLLSDATGDITKSNTDKFFREMDKVFDAGNIPDPGTLRGRLEAAQRDETIKADILKGFGENEGTGAIKQILDASSTAAQSLSNSIKTISFDPKLYQSEVKDQASLTPQIAIGTALKKSEARDKAFAESDDASAIAATKKIVAEALEQTSPRGISGALDRSFRTMWGTGIGPAPSGDHSIGGYGLTIPRAAYNLLYSHAGTAEQNGLQTIDYGIDRLKGQKEFIEETSIFGLTQGDKDKQSELDKSIRVLEELRANFTTAIQNQTKSNQDLVAEVQKQNTLMVEQNALLKNKSQPSFAPSSAAIQAQSQAGVNQGIRAQ